MGSIIKVTTACGLALGIVCLLAIGQSEPARAQGSSIVCSFGSKKYKECCKQSFKEHPKLAARKRADDIDACMDAKPKPKEPAAKDSAPKEAPKETPKEAPKASSTGEKK